MITFAFILFALMIGLMLGLFFNGNVRRQVAMKEEIERLQEELSYLRGRLQHRSLSRTSAKIDSISHNDYMAKLSNLRLTKAMKAIYKISAERLPRIICRRDEDTVSKIFKLAEESLYPNGQNKED